MRRINSIALSLIFCLTIQESTRCSQQNNSPLNSISWVYVAVPGLAIASTVFGYYWWKNHTELNEDKQRLKKADEASTIKAKLLESMNKKEKKPESLATLLQINQLFSPTLTQAKEDNDIEALYQAHLTQAASDNNTPD